MSEFALSFSQEEKSYLLDIARSRIDFMLHGQPPASPPPPTDMVEEKFGAFVTLKCHGKLRGCIGRLISEDPLFSTVGDMAEAAAFHDSRFPPLTVEEFPSLDLEISVMGPIARCPDPSLVVVGKHGLIMRKGNRQGLLLPQVPVEWEWDRETFLAHTCRKAGLPPDAWQDPQTEIYWFEALVF